MRLLTGLFLCVTLSSFMGCDLASREPRTADSAPKQEVAEGSGGGKQMPASRGALPSSINAPMAQARIASSADAVGKGGGGGGGRNTGSITDDASSVSLASIGTAYAATE